MVRSSSLHVQRRRRRKPKNNLKKKQAQGHRANNDDRRSHTTEEEQDSHSSFLPFAHCNTSVEICGAPYQLPSIGGCATWLLTNYRDFFKLGFEFQRTRIAQELKECGWSGSCCWVAGSVQWHLIGIKDDSVRSLVLFSTRPHFAIN